MKAKRFTDEQIIAVLREAEAGAKAKDLETENGKLKRLLAEAELDKAALKDLLGREW